MKHLEELTLPAERAMIPRFLDLVATHAKTVGYSDARVGEIKGAVSEALTNIIDFICTEGQEIHLTCGDDKRRRFTVDISDSGKSFNMLLEADPFLSGSDPGQKRPSVRFIKKIGDVEYKRFEGKNHVIITVYPEYGNPEWAALGDDPSEESAPKK
ncbi:MAG TPA: ATP-binding protein [Syntrophorhabdaceae bacterium]|jgi:hypothetical protein